MRRLPGKHAKAERRLGETAAVRDRGGAGNPARRLGLATDGENADRGRRVDVEGTSQSCGPGSVEQQGVLEMHQRRD